MALNNRNNFIGATSPAGSEGARATQLLNSFRRFPRLLHSLPLTQNGERSCLSPPELQGSKAPEKETYDFTKLGERISKLVKMMGGGRRSIHQAMRDLIASMSSLYQQAAKDKVAEKKFKGRMNVRST